MADNKEPTIYNNEEIRIVMVGKTGAGKSAAGNTILGHKCFESDFSPKSVTKECQKAYGEVDGQRVSVIDTPGLFDTKTDKKTTQANIIQCMSYASPGPHIFLIVIKLDRFTEEEKKTVEMIQEIFGEEADKFSMVLFTHGDQLRGKPIGEFLKKSKDLPELVARCNGQYQVFDNNLKDGSQVTELINKIRKITENNRGHHYTTEMFQKAERAIKEEKQRILKEKEEQMCREQEEVEREIKEKYEKQLKEAKENVQKEKELKEAQQKELEEKTKALKKEQEEKARREAEKSPKVLKVVGLVCLGLGGALGAVGLTVVAGAAAAAVAAGPAGAAVAELAAGAAGAELAAGPAGAALAAGIELAVRVFGAISAAVAAGTVKFSD